MTYPFKKIEQKWQKKWKDEGTFVFDANGTGEKAYVLEMFPYPSGHLHMGHVRNYTIGDVVARFLRNKGLNVLHPMGWDAFGLPAENAAIEHAASNGGGASPSAWTYANIEVMRDQLQALGLGFDWSREFASCDTDYFGLEQKIFLDMYARGLAYQAENFVNWDPVEHTVLANEQVVNGCGWRSGVPVEKKRLRQWSLKITDYAEELLNSLNDLPKWPEKIRKMQENWIGRSEGALIHFTLDQAVDGQTQIPVFSTRPDTLYGAAFVAIAPTHPIATYLSKDNPDLLSFIKECGQTSTAEADLATAEKRGYQTTLFAHVPITGEKVPVYVANFVLMDYGTGAVFGCPAHDARDFDFATKYNIPMKQVVAPKDQSTVKLPFLEDGVVINSGEWNGLSTDEAKTKALDRLETEHQGQRKITYRLRDWGISRQRYWGCPIPIIYCEDCGTVPVPAADLPVTLPKDPDFSTPGNPLDHHPTWKHTKCPTCSKPALRETDTFDTFFESSWYFLRFIDPKFEGPVNKELSNRLMPVDVYVGGPEHAVMHLLYARFFVKALRDMGYINVDEPFYELLTQGMVCHQTFKDANGKWVFPSDVFKEKDGSYILKDGSPVTVGRSEKMSKSKKNTVDPLHIIDSYGADTARLFVMSDTPYDKDFDWNEDSLDGVWRYLSKIHRLGEGFIEKLQIASPIHELPLQDFSLTESAIKLEKETHRFIKNITEAYERYGFNKVIALHREFCRIFEEALSTLPITHTLFPYRILIQTIAPLIPHLSEELWENLYKNLPLLHYIPLHTTPWPTYLDDIAALDTITLAVQVNGKMRGSIQVAPDAAEDIIKEEALNLHTVTRDISGKTIRRIIIVPGRIINIVAS